MNMVSKAKYLFITVLCLCGISAANAQTADPVKHGLQLIELGNPDAAVAELKNTVAANPKSADAHAAYAIANIAVNNVAVANTEAQAAFDLDRRSVLARTARAMVYGKQGNVSDALKEFTQALKLNDKEIGTYLALSRYYIAIDSLKPAEVMLYRAQSVNDKDVRSYLGLAELYEKQRIPDLAITQYESAKKLDPNDVTVMAKLGALYFRTRRYNESINEWIKLLRVDSTYSDAYYQVANMYYLGEQYANAAGFAEKYVLLEPNSVQGNWLLARSLTEIGQYQKALPALEKVAGNDSLKALSQNLLAKSYFLSKDFPKAMSIYKQANALTAEDLDYYGRSLLLTGDTTQALEKLKLSLASTDTNRKESAKDQTRQIIVSILYQQKKYDEAAEMFKQMAQTKPTATIYATIGQMLAAAGKTGEAADYYQKAMTLDPNTLKTQLLLGQLYTQNKDTWPQMKETFQKLEATATSMSKMDTAAIAQGYLGSYYLQNKQYDNAEQSLEKSVKALDEKSPYLTSFDLTLAQTYHFEKKYAKATEYYNKVLQRDPNNKTAQDGLKLLKQAGSGK